MNVNYYLLRKILTADFKIGMQRGYYAAENEIFEESELEIPIDDDGTTRQNHSCNPLETQQGAHRSRPGIWYEGVDVDKI